MRSVGADERRIVRNSESEDFGHGISSAGWILRRELPPGSALPSTKRLAGGLIWRRTCSTTDIVRREEP